MADWGAQPRKAPLGFPPGRRDGFLARFTGQSRWLPHFHNELEMNLVVRGTVGCAVAGRTVTLERGHVLWLPPETGHALVEHSADCVMWVGFFTPTLVRRHCPDEAVQALLQPAGEPPVKRLASRRLVYLHALFDDLVDAEPARLAAGLPYALVTTWDAYSTEAGGRREDVQEAVVRAVFLLSEEPQIDGVDALAARVGLAPSTLSRLFKRHVGTSIVEYRNARRLDRFFELSRAGVGITTAAMQAGFGSYPQFYRVFRKATGRSPREHETTCRK